MLLEFSFWSALTFLYKRNPCIFSRATSIPRNYNCFLSSYVIVAWHQIATYIFPFSLQLFQQNSDEFLSPINVNFVDDKMKNSFCNTNICGIATKKGPVFTSLWGHDEGYTRVIFGPFDYWLFWGRIPLLFRGLGLLKRLQSPRSKLWYLRRRWQMLVN